MMNDNPEDASGIVKQLVRMNLTLKRKSAADWC